MAAAGIDRRYLPLNAGPLSCSFDTTTGCLRDVCWGDRCVWRELAVLVRDDQWQTVPGRVAGLQAEISEDCFEVQFDCRHDSGPIKFQWRGLIRAKTTGSIRYEFEGRALSQFAANRIGFCLLHPSELYAGSRVRQTRSDGRVIESRFPILVEPQIVGRYPICDLRGLAHEIEQGVWGDAEFEGDLFETEDQRNWTDASFKTYCTPLANPFPVVLQPGESRAQAVCLSFRTAPVESAPRAPRAVEGHRPATVSRPARSRRVPIPEFGLSLAAIGEVFPADRQGPLNHLCRRLAADFLRYDLPLRQDGRWQPNSAAHLEKAVAVAEQAGCRLELVVQLPSAGSVCWEELGDAMRHHTAQLARILVYRRGRPVTLREDVVALRRAMRTDAIPIGGGSDANFCELNREQALGNFPVDELDFIAWSISPQVHATDDLSLVETVRSLVDLVRTANTFAGGKPILITPITLKPRFNAVATRASDADAWPIPPADDRQQDEICAAWSLAAWQVLATSGAGSATWFEVFGPRGVASVDDRSEAFSLYPVGNAFGQLQRISPTAAEPLETESSHVLAMLLHATTGPQQLLVNTSSERRLVEMDAAVCGASDAAKVVQLLQPYEVKFLECAGVTSDRGRSG